MPVKLKKRLRLLGIMTIILTLIGLFVLHNVLPYAIISKHNRVPTVLPEKYGLQVTPATFKVADSIVLKGYYSYPKVAQPKGIIILLHGIGGVKEHFYELAKSLADHQIASVLYDARAHGESNGEYVTYGFHEKYDVQFIVDQIKQKHPELPIGIWGNSMGGAVALQALAIGPQIDFGIIESNFTDLNQIVYDYQKRYAFGIGFRFATNYALKRAGEIAQFDPKQVSPIQAVKTIDQPIFMSHGTADPNIKFEYGKKLHEHLKSQNKVFYPVEGGGHFGLSQKGGEAYNKALFDFIQKQLNSSSDAVLGQL